MYIHTYTYMISGRKKEPFDGVGEKEKEGEEEGEKKEWERGKESRGKRD